DTCSPGVQGLAREPAEEGVGCRAWMVDRSGLGDHQRRAAEGALTVVLAHPAGGSAVDGPGALHSRHDEPVPQAQLPDLQRLQQRRDVRAGGFSPSLKNLCHALSATPDRLPTLIIAALIIAAFRPAAKWAASAEPRDDLRGDLLHVPGDVVQRREQ